jgi:hypothetical protein
MSSQILESKNMLEKQETEEEDDDDDSVRTGRKKYY